MSATDQTRTETRPMSRASLAAPVAIFASLPFVTGAALAVPLSPDAQVGLAGTTNISEPYLASENVFSQQFPFVIENSVGQPIFQGTLTFSIVRSDMLDTLIFQYRVTNTQAVGNAAITRIDLIGYEGFSTNVNFRTDGLGQVGPSQAARIASGNDVRFLFPTAPIAGGQGSRFMHIITNAPLHTPGGRAVIRLNSGERVVIEGLRMPSDQVGSCSGDANWDGVVNFADLNAVLTNFGQSCP